MLGAETERRQSNSTILKFSVADVVKKTTPSVVNIYTRTIVRKRQRMTLFDDPFFRHFFGTPRNKRKKNELLQKQNSLGSGVIINAEGLIVTNQHVIEGADEIRVVLHDRREFAANLIATDDKTDLSFLKVKSLEPLPFIQLADSDLLQVGDFVLAIGNPFGVGQTVTSGIISALSRSGIGLSKFSTFIQTDAAINPGNSGGGLITIDGKLAGINTAIFSKSGGSHGIGFAIPSNMVNAVIRGISDSGILIRGWLGATGQALTYDIASSLGLDRPKGILISSLYKFSSVAKAGLKIGDIILKINGHKVLNPNELAYRIATFPVNKLVTINVFRKGKIFDINFILNPAPEIPKRNTSVLSGNQPLSGVVAENLSPFLAERMKMDPYLEGVVISKVKSGSPAEKLGFRYRDIINVINSVQITNVENLKSQLKLSSHKWRIDILRNGNELSLVINR